MRTKRNSEELLTGARAHQSIVDAVESGNPAKARAMVGQSMVFFLKHGRVLRAM
jgi:hypothetical protein